MILDAVLGDRRCWWLSPECDKRAFFDLTQQTGLRSRGLPAHRVRSGAEEDDPLLPGQVADRHREGDTSRFVFLYLVNRRIPVDFRQFLIRHADLFRVLHHWTVRLLLPRRFRKAAALYKAALREQLWTPLNPSVSKSLETYFRERQEQGGHLGDPSDRYVAQEFRKQGMPKIQALYRAWRRSGDKVLWQSSSTVSARRLVLWPFGGRGSVVEPPVPPAHRLDGPGCVGQEGGEAKIASGWPPGFDTLSRRSLTPGGSMSAHSVQASVSQHLAASTPPRRRFVPPSSSETVSQSVNQRWRERPRCRALRLTPAALTGSFTPSLVVSRVAVCVLRSCRRIAPPARPIARRDSARTKCADESAESVRARCPVLPENTSTFRSRSSRPTIASMMLAPCSASSMLSASLRPGRWPGLRALTTPPRGTRWQLRDGGHLMTVHNDVDANIRRAYVGFITSVPHGTPPVRRNGIWSAHSPTAPGHGLERIPHNIAACCRITDSG